MSKHQEVDALVVGAGMAGIFFTYRLSHANLSVQCVEAAGDVGGTWYWNRYPGAMSDTESYLYRYSWDKDDLQTYPWSRHYVYQADILEYLRHVVNKHDIRKHMQFNTEMKSATWDEHQNRWIVDCLCSDSSGEDTTCTYRARYLILCVGLLSEPVYPDIPGIDSFTGDMVHTARWDESITVEGKTVGIIGNGSTGTQVMTAIAPKVGKLVSFQRHPQYSVPSRQGLIPDGYRETINSNYDRIWQDVWASATGFGVPEVSRKTMETSPEERQQLFQQVWDQGNGFRFMFSAFGDMTTDKEANEEACRFLRGKIQEIVKDPRKAKAVTPWEPYARRPLCNNNYYDIFNRGNVDVIDLRESPIDSIVPEGVRTTDGEVHPLDVLIFATGFDAVEGSVLRVKIQGRGGKSMQEHWGNGPTAYAGVACAGFPNMFLVPGPQGSFANYPPKIESEGGFAMECILHSERTMGAHVIEVSSEAEQKWDSLCHKLTEGSLFKSTASWLFGANVAHVEGRQTTTKFYFGGIAEYRKLTHAELHGGFPSFWIV